MAKFSQGFMDVLSRTGTPQAAMQQGQQAAPAYGSLQRNLGAAFGMDQRSRPEMASSAIDRIDPNSKDALRQSLLVSAKYEQDPQRKILMLAKVAELDQAAALEKAKVDKEKEQTDSFAQFAEKKYPELKPLIESGVVTGTNINKFVSPPSETGKSTNSYSYNDSGRVVDSKGNIFNRVVRRVNSGPNAGEIDVVLAGASGSPSSPVGPIVPVGGQFDQTPEQAAALKGEIEAERGWGKTLSSAVEVLPAARESRSSAQRALTLAQQLETGGFTAELKKAATDFFGVTPTNEGEFAVLVQDMMVTKLGQAIKGNPTAAEMGEIKKTMAAVGKSKGLNIRILSSAIDQLDRLISRSEYLMTPDVTKDGYSKFIAAQYESTGSDEEEEGFVAGYILEAQKRAASLLEAQERASSQGGN